MKYFIILLGLIFIPTVSFADEDSLYAPAPPADSAFVRTINATGNIDTLIKINQTSLMTENKSEVISDYNILKEGKHKINFGEMNDEIELDAGKYYSIAITPNNEVKIYEDALIENPTKAVVYFCNFSKIPASLISKEFEATLFENVESLSCESREINAVDFDLNVSNDDGEIKNFPKVSLKRQMGTSVIIMDGETYLIENKVSQ